MASGHFFANKDPAITPSTAKPKNGSKIEKFNLLSSEKETAIPDAEFNAITTKVEAMAADIVVFR